MHPESGGIAKVVTDSKNTIAPNQDATYAGGSLVVRVQPGIEKIFKHLLKPNRSFIVCLVCYWQQDYRDF